MRLSAEAPAKINRELRVGRLRSDGYHEVFSRMVSIDLSDRLTVESSEDLRFSCDDPGRASFLGPNDLTPAVLQVEPRMEAYLASAARVSEERAVCGSGSTIVLAAPHEARDELARHHPEARLFVCTTLARGAYRLRTNPNGGSS